MVWLAPAHWPLRARGRGRRQLRLAVLEKESSLATHTHQSSRKFRRHPRARGIYYKPDSRRAEAVRNKDRGTMFEYCAEANGLPVEESGSVRGRKREKQQNMDAGKAMIQSLTFLFLSPHSFFCFCRASLIVVRRRQRMIRAIATLLDRGRQERPCQISRCSPPSNFQSPGTKEEAAELGAASDRQASKLEAGRT